MAVKHKHVKMFPLAAILLCSTGFSQNMPTSTKPNPAHLGPLAPDPRIKQHKEHVQPKLSDIAEQIKSAPPPAAAIPPRKPSAVKIIDPKIPGIKIIPFANAEFASLPDADRLGTDAFAIKNESPHSIVSIGVTYMIGGKGYTCFGDGISTTVNVPNGVTITAAPFWMKAANSDGGCSGEGRYSIDPSEAFVEFLMFDNGDFYGDEEWEARLRNKSAIRLKFFEEAFHSKDQLEFMKTAKTAKLDKLTVDEQRYRDDLIDDYQALVEKFGQDAKDFVNHFRNLALRFPKVKKVTRLARDGVNPEVDSGWWSGSVYATCANGSPAYRGGLYFGCTYPNNSVTAPPQPPSGALNAASPTGFWARFGASCLQQNPPNAIQIENYISDGLATLIILPGSDALQAQYTPRENIYTNYSPDLADKPDTFHFRVLAGIMEPFSPLAPVDGGETSCRADWYSSLFPKTPTTSHPLLVGPTGQLYYLNGAGTPIVRNGPYGYILANRKTDNFCNPSRTQRIDWYDTAPLKEGPVNHDGIYYTEYTVCTHTAPSAGNGPQKCDPYSDFCCCMATFNNMAFCIASMPDESSIGQFPGSAPSCAYGAGAAAAVAATGKVAPIGTAAASQANGAGLGIFRPASGYFLTDPTGTGQYIAGDTTVSTFIPPGGIQAGDVPVSGDWTGSGHTRVGFFRPSVGQWYVDLNGNGTWDGLSGGDIMYTFGGIMPSGTPGTTGYIPGDVPIVGDWQGGGVSCIGVFRYGYYWILDTNCNGQYDGGDNAFAFGGIPGDVPVVGKWGGINASMVGVVRCYINPSTGQCSGPPYYWILDTGSAVNPYQAQHYPGQGPVGCGLPNPKYYAQCVTPAPFAFGGLPGDQYVTGDWLGNGTSYPGIYRNGSWILDTDGTQQHLQYFNFGGLGGDVPLVGKW
jgi:hypothetical protein